MVVELSAVGARMSSATITPSDVKPDEVRRLATPSWPRWMVAMAGDWLVIVAAFIAAGLVNHWLIYLLAVIVVGNRQHALLILMHEGSHRLISRRVWLNNWSARLFCAWPAGTPLLGYRAFHFAHHRHLGTAQDPELKHKALFRQEFTLPAKRRRFVRLFFTDLAGLGSRNLLRFIVDLVRPARREMAGIALFWASVVALAWALDGLWVVALWFSALMTSNWAFFRLRIWLEHQGTSGTQRVALKRWQRLIAPHNTYLHYEHHRWPAVPFWNLPRARELDQEVPIQSIAELFRSLARGNAAADEVVVAGRSMQSNLI